MKKLLILLAGAILLLTLSALAGNPSPWPPIGQEVEVWMLINGQWVSLGTGGEFSEARAFRSGGASGDSNYVSRTIHFENHASLAQWVEWSMTGTRWDWFVRKVGCYAADCIGFLLKSNQDVDIIYKGFEDLLYQGTGGITKTIPVWYAVWDGAGVPTDDKWVRSTALNGDHLILDSEALHQGISHKLWNKICTQPSNSACEYEDDAEIIIELKVIKPWIEPLRGGYKPLG